MLKTPRWLAAIAMVSCWHVGGPAFAAPSDPNPIAGYSQQVLLKNHALSYCISRIARDGDLSKDAMASAAAYFEFGNQGLEAYEQVRLLADRYVGLKYVAKPEPGAMPSELDTMKCIDLFHSDELDRLVRLSAKKKSR